MDNLLSPEQIKLEVGNGDDSQRYQLINGRLISVDTDTSHLLEPFSSDADLGLSTQQDVLNSVYSDVHEGVAPLDDDPLSLDGGVIIQLMDIRTSLSKLRTMLEQRIGADLSGYEFWLQDSKKLDINKSLVDQCINRAGLVQVNIQIRVSQKRINIVDVLKPDEEFIQMTDTDKCEFGKMPDVSQENIDMGADSSESMPLSDPQPSIPNVEASSAPQAEDSTMPASSMAKWLVDENFRADQIRLQIPQDPKLWTVMQVRHWIQWAVRQFKLTGIKLSDWTISGKELCALSLLDFKKKCPSDPGDLFWTHLELMRKCGVVAIMQTEEEMMEMFESVPENYSAIRRKTKQSNPSTTKATNSQPVTLMSAGVNRSGNNGQIQLWQFLLELLTSTEHTSVIQWIGTSGEFKLQEPAVVAQLWGKRKHKPTMNYEKLSRALRYYYDGDMISKVHGKRFVYRFVCDLKQLIGYDAGELAKLVNAGAQEHQNVEILSWQGDP